MVKCPNKNHPEWIELERLLPNQAYVVWDAFPYGIDKAPNGADSKLFKDLLEHYNGDRDSAIRAKAKTATEAFKMWFEDRIPTFDPNTGEIIEVRAIRSKAVDENGEPLVMWHRTSSKNIESFDPRKINGDDGFWFSKDKDYYTSDNKVSAYPVFLKTINPFEIKHSSFLAGMDATHFSFDELRKGNKKDFDSLITYTEHTPEFYEDTSYIEQYGTFISVQNPNQIKSIDNVGDFSTSSNIYYKLANDVQEAKNSMYGKPTVVDKMFYSKMKEFHSTSSALKYLYDNKFIAPEVRKLAELLMKHDVDLMVGKSRNESGPLAYYLPSDAMIVMNQSAFYDTPARTAFTLMHEVLHHYLGHKYETDDTYKKHIDRIQNKYRKMFGELSMLHYGLKADGSEFVNEILSDPTFAAQLREQDNRLWEQLKRLLAKALQILGINTASAYSIDDIIKELMVLVEDVSNRSTTISDDERTSDEQGLAAKQSKEDSVYMNNLKKDAQRIRQRIKNGLESRIKALEQYGKVTSNQVMRLQQEINKLEAMFEQNEDKLALVEFIKHTSLESVRPVKVVNKAHEELKNTGKFSLRNDQLVQLQRDFIGFYEPILEDINLKLYKLDYFDDMDETDRAFIDNQISIITDSFSIIKSKYSNLLAQRFGEILLKYGNEYDSPTIKTYVDDNVNTTNTDLNFYHTFIGGMRNVNDEALRLIARRVTDTQNSIERTTVKKASEILPIFKAVKDWQPFYEVDEKGKKTGYLVRDKNYGRYFRDRDAYFDSLGEAPIGDKEALKEWYTKRNKWLSEHAERRYKPEYYDLFNSMSFAAREARDNIQLEISMILTDYTDKQGDVHLENIPDDSWKKLQGLYEQKRLLANHFNADGSRKTGINEEIADDLSRINKILNKELTYKANIKKFNEVNDKKKATLTPEQYSKWYDRSTRISYSEEFQEKLKKLERRYYNEEYERLSDERRELTGMYRNLHDFAINTINMPQSVKDMIKQLDIQMNEIASKYPKEKSEFTELAHIEYSKFYREEKDAASARDKIVPGYYKQWRDNNHYIDSAGRLVPYSYFNLMLPNDKNNVVIVPSREYSEADPTSNYWNHNFDPNDPEYAQPKRSLYDNQAAYDKIVSDPKMKAMYDTILDTMSDSNNKLTFMKRKNNYKLPQISGTMWAHMQANDSMIKGLSTYIQDSFIVKQDDKDYNIDTINKMTAPDGRRLSTIPVHYVKMLDNPAAITNNLGGAIIKYFEMAENFTQKQGMLADLELLQEQIDKRTYDPEIRNEVVGKLDKVRRLNLGSTTNISKRLSTYYNINVYGQKYNPVTIGNFNITKILVHFKSYATLVNLGLSPFVAAANFMGGLGQHITESITGVFYTPKTAALAFRESVYYLGNTILHGGNYTKSNKMLSMMNFNQISRETSNMYEKLNYNRFARFLSNHGWYGMMTAGDMIVKSQIMMSVYFNTKFVPGEGFMTRDEYYTKYGKDRTNEVFDNLNTPTLWDIYEQDGTTVKIKDKYDYLKDYVTPEFVNRMTNTVRYLAQRADGMVDQSEKNTAQANAVIGFCFMHKNFLLSAIEDRVLKPTAYNYMTGRMDEAQYKTAINRFVEFVKYLNDLRKYYVSEQMAAEDKPKLRKLENYQKYNLKRVTVEFGQLIVYLLISLALTRWDDNDDTWLTNALLYAHDRAAYEAGNLYNPWDVYNSFKTLSPASASLENFKTLIGGLEFWNWDNNFNKSVKYGPYKGMNKMEKAVWKVTPLKNIIEATDPKQKHKYLKGQLQ